MTIPVTFVVPLGLLFFASGLVINLLQFVCSLLIWPLSKSIYRRINRLLEELLLLELIWVFDWWAGVKRPRKILQFASAYDIGIIQLYMDSQAFHLMGKEHAITVSNHRSDIDWLVGWVLAQRSGCLGSALAVMKKPLKFLPVIGWSLWFSEYLFLERSWAKDESTLKSGLLRLKDYPLPFWVAFYMEGTRFTQEKLLAAQAYAASNGLPIPRNVLIPRTKGFVSAVRYMRSFVPAIYDATMVIPKNSPPPTMLRLFTGQPSVVHLHVKRYSIKDLPENDEAVAQWCRDLFRAKDALLDRYAGEGTFSDQELQDIGRPIKSLLVVSFWACLLILGTLKFLHWSSVLSSWKGIGFSAFGFSVIALLMQILIRSSQSELSTPLKAASVKTENGVGRDKQQ